VVTREDVGKKRGGKKVQKTEEGRVSNQQKKRDLSVPWLYLPKSGLRRNSFGGEAAARFRLTERKKG